MKRILFFVSSMRGGGAERVASLLCNHWAEQGHEVILVPTFSGRGECLYRLDERVRLDYLADRVNSTRNGLVNLMRRFLALRATVRREKPDVVVSFLTHVNVAVLLATLGFSVPVIVSERIYPPLMPLAPHWRWLRWMTYPLADAVVMQTDQGNQWLGDYCPKAKGKVIPNPVVYPLPFGEPGLCPDDSVKLGQSLVLAVGRLECQKGFDLLIRSFSRLADDFPSWYMVILGEGSERRRLEKLVTDLGLAGRVYLSGRVGNVADWYGRADLYVMSSRFEGFPNTLAEAMAHGLAAVSFDCATGPRDIIRHGVDGLLVPPAEGDEGLARAIRQLMADEKTRCRMMERAKVVRARFSMARIGALWSEVLDLGEQSDVI